jgi:UDPglucose 6-dehydrogenase
MMPDKRGAEMRICVVGTGYVGLVCGTCLADQGFQVTCVDRDEEKIAGLKAGEIPIYEPGLEDILRRAVRRGVLDFTTDGPAAIAGADVVYIAVGTPSTDDGSADMGAVHAVADLIGQSMTGPCTVVIKSTVPVGTADAVRGRIAAGTQHKFDVVSNPEFLKEGAAVDDFTHPDRIVVGCRSPESVKVMQTLYAGLVRTGRPIVFMDNRSAELTKYAANALLATKISFMNELARLCEAVDADVEAVRLGVGSDSRIGPRFLFAGAGYGGSCFPKDIRALRHQARAAGVELEIPAAVESINETQKHHIANKILDRFGPDLSGRTFCVWGLAFKPRTDDVREAPALVVIRRLLDAGASIQAYDPEATEEAKHDLREHPGADRVTYADSRLSAAEGADALVLMTEWSEFRNPDFQALGRILRERVLLDGRNIYPPEVVTEAGFEYHGIGRKA